MSKAAALVRQSQGTEDSISLSLQRERVTALTADLADETEMIDLGVQSGFSIHSWPEKDDRIDQAPKMIALIDALRAGEYDVLAAWDDTRIARDQYYWVVKTAAIEGGAELAFVDPIPDDRLTFRVMRAVESEIKRREIAKTLAAIEKRDEEGYYQGRPPFGLQFDDQGQHLVPDPDEFPTVLNVLNLRSNGLSYSEIADETPMGKSKVGRIVRNSDRYEGHLPS